MKVSLVYAKEQDLREKAARACAGDPAAVGSYARDEIYPPLGITLLAAWLEREGHEVRLFDDSLDPIDEIRRGMDWADAVGISVLTPNARRGRALGRMARLELEKPVVMGGPHPTTSPEFFLRAEAADVCVQGEGDRTLPEWLAVLDRPDEWERVQGITFVRDGELVATPRRPLLRDMDALPYPAYHLWDVGRFVRHMVTPGLMMVTSRGCPYSCTFCDAEMTPRQYRSMSPGRTVDEIEHLLATLDPPLINFADDLFTIQRKRVIAICQEILRRGLCFEWIAESRVDTMDYEMLRWMKRAGCVKIGYGLESGSPRMLLTMKKDVTPEKVERGSRLNRELGMFFKFFVLYGLPGDTREDHRLTEELVAATRPDLVVCSIFQPIPGTEAFESIRGELLVEDVAEVDFNYGFSGEAWKHPNFTIEELQAERARLQKLHARATRGPRARLRRKLERLRAMVRHPELVGDWFEARARRRRFRQRVERGRWGAGRAAESLPVLAERAV